MTEYVQGGMFGGMTSAPLDFNPQFGSTPATPSITPVPNLPGSTPFSERWPSSSGSALGGGTVAAPNGALPGMPLPSATSSPPAGTPSAGGGQATGFLGLPSDWFFRAVLIILGMIFVAVGLHMFAPSIVPDVRKVARA